MPKKPKKWDGKWRILIFDISEPHKIKREALRGKLKEWKLYQLQKSVWISPYDLQKEISILRDFFGLNFRELTVITANMIDDEKSLKRHFKL
jgi:phenylacetic acid degradation operon negative regulatory protein